MVRHLTFGLIVTIWLSVAPALASDDPATRDKTERAGAEAATVVSPFGKRPAVLPPLYASLVSVQAADIYTTSRSLKSGAREANPVMGSLVGNLGVVVAVKSAATVSTILLTERLWKRGRKGAAIAVMIAANVATAAIAAHNVRVTLRAR